LPGKPELLSSAAHAFCKIWPLYERSFLLAPLREKRRDRGKADRRKAKPYIIARDLAFEPPGGGFHGINIEGFPPLARTTPRAPHESHEDTYTLRFD
jgi:hypothetical protein